MKALTIHQPFALALATGLKQYETRPRRTNHRGKFGIHAGLHVDEESLGRLINAGIPLDEHVERPLSRRWSVLSAEDLPTGCIVAIGEITDCIEMTEEFIAQQTPQEIALGGWEVGRFAYKVENVERLDQPIPARGKQGMWDWDETSEV